MIMMFENHDIITNSHLFISFKFKSSILKRMISLSLFHSSKNLTKDGYSSKNWSIIMV